MMFSRLQILKIDTQFDPQTGNIDFEVGSSLGLSYEDLNLWFNRQNDHRKMKS